MAQVRVFASGDQSFDDDVDTLLLPLNRSVSLAPGASTRFTVNALIPAGLTPGDYYLVVDVQVVDELSPDSFVDADLDNNVVATTNLITVNAVASPSAVGGKDRDHDREEHRRRRAA